MESELLKAYNLRTLDPQSWDEDTISRSNNTDVDQSVKDQNNYILEFVNKDVEGLDFNNIIDPLNPSKSIDARNIPDSNPAKYSIESKQFNSKQFLRLIHKEDTFNQLCQSLTILDNSITEQNLELKTLVKKEYLAFVRSKTSLDTVLQQFSSKGFGGDPDILKPLRARVNDANKEGALLIKPVISNKQKEIKLKQSIEFIQKNKFFFMLPKALKTYLSENDYDNFIHDYKKAKQLKNDESDRNTNKIISRIWENVENTVDTYKKQLWGQLTRESLANDDSFLKIIKKLIELEAIDNPILEWIDFKLKLTYSNFNGVFKKYLEKILNIQLNIISTIKESDYSSFRQVESISLKGEKHVVPLVDSTLITEMWLMTNKLFEELEEQVKKFIMFWRHVENIIDGQYDSKLTSSYVDASSPFMHFERYEINDIKKKGEQFISQVTRKLMNFFDATQESLKLVHDLHNGSAESHREGKLEDFGFLPPFTNSFSTLRYLPTISSIILNFLNDLGQLSITDKSISDLRDVSNFITERIVGSICASWLNDCQNFYKLENWSRVDEGETETPGLILNFQNYIVESLGNFLFKKSLISSNETKEFVQIVRYPSKKILTGIEIQFLRSFDLLLESIIKKIIKENHDTNVNKKVKNYHKLLTLFNIKKLVSTALPQSIQTFDSVFDTKLQDRNLEIYSLLEKMEVTIFDSFINDQRKLISKIISSGIPKVDWGEDSKKTLNVSSYIYQTLNVLVQVHTTVLTVSAELIHKVLDNLLEYIGISLLKQFREQSIVNQRQLVLDVEFFKAIIGRSITEQSLKHINLIYTNCEINPKALISNINEELEDAILASKIEKEIFNAPT